MVLDPEERAERRERGLGRSDEVLVTEHVIPGRTDAPLVTQGKLQRARDEPRVFANVGLADARGQDPARHEGRARIPDHMHATRLRETAQGACEVQLVQRALLGPISNRIELPGRAAHLRERENHGDERIVRRSEPADAAAFYPGADAPRELDIRIAARAAAAEQPERGHAVGEHQAADPDPPERGGPLAGRQAPQRAVKVREQVAFARQHGELGMRVEQIAHERRAAAVRTENEQRPLDERPGPPVLGIARIEPTQPRGPRPRERGVPVADRDELVAALLRERPARHRRQSRLDFGFEGGDLRVVRFGRARHLVLCSNGLRAEPVGIVSSGAIITCARLGRASPSIQHALATRKPTAPPANPRNRVVAGRELDVV